MLARSLFGCRGCWYNWELNKRDMFCINESHNAMHLAKKSTYPAMTKHINVHYNFIRSLLKDDMLTLVKIYDSKNLVVKFIKLVTIEKLKLCTASTRLQSWGHFSSTPNFITKVGRFAYAFSIFKWKIVMHVKIKKKTKGFILNRSYTPRFNKLSEIR